MTGFLEPEKGVTDLQRRVYLPRFRKLWVRNHQQVGVVEVISKGSMEVPDEKELQTAPRQESGKLVYNRTSQKNNSSAPLTLQSSLFLVICKGSKAIATWWEGVNKRWSWPHGPFLEVIGSSQRRWKEALPLIELEALMIMWRWEFLINKLNCLWNKFTWTVLYLPVTKKSHFYPSFFFSPGAMQGLCPLRQFKETLGNKIKLLFMFRPCEFCFINSMRFMALSKLLKLLIPHL